MGEFGRAGADAVLIGVAVGLFASIVGDGLAAGMVVLLVDEFGGGGKMRLWAGLLARGGSVDRLEACPTLPQAVAKRSGGSWRWYLRMSFAPAAACLGVRLRASARARPKSASILLKPEPSRVRAPSQRPARIRRHWWRAATVSEDRRQESEAGILDCSPAAGSYGAHGVPALPSETGKAGSA